MLATTVVPSTSANLWHLRMGHLNFPDLCILKGKATGIDFVGEPCFCQTCVMAKMRRAPFQIQGESLLPLNRIFALMSQGHTHNHPRKIVFFECNM